MSIFLPEQTYNWDTCINPDYNFTCNIDGVRYCLNPILIYDGVQICDDGNNEKAWTPSCLQRLVKDKLINSKVIQ